MIQSCTISQEEHKTIFNDLKGQCHEIFASGFFHESVSPMPLSIPLGPIRIFSRIRGDIRSSRLTTGINDTGGEFATGVNDTDGKIAAGINDTGGKIATGINDTSGKFCHQFH
jgi:hypothetical protein